VLPGEVAGPSQVWNLVQALGNDRLSAAVERIVVEQRRQAEARVAALEAELQAARAELSALPATGAPA
jgi:hypothetical protein